MLHSKPKEDNYLHKGLRKQLVQVIRDKGITDEKVLAAIEAVPRHFFLDPAFERQAYENRAFLFQQDKPSPTPTQLPTRPSYWS